MKEYKILGAVSAVLGLIACSDTTPPMKLKDGAALRLADGSAISQAATDESNARLVLTSDGYLFLAFSSDRGCGLCIAGKHNIFFARSLATYKNDGRLPAFAAPTVFSVAGVALNQANAINFALAASGTTLRLFFNNNIGKIQWREFSPGGGNYDVSYLQIIDNWLWQAHKIAGISANGQRLLATGSDGIVSFDPFGSDAVLTPIINSADAQAVVQVSQAVAGFVDAYMVLRGGIVRASSHTTQGISVNAVNVPVSEARVTLRSLSVLHTAEPAGELVLLSGTDSGSSASDMYVLEGETGTPSKIWQRLADKPASTGIPVAAERHPAAATPTRVYGQTDFVSNTQGVSATRFARPHDVFADPKGGIFVADGHGVGGGTGRVVYFPGISTTAIEPPVYGKSSLTDTGAGVTSTRTDVNVQAVFVDASGVYVADTGNNRVLFFPLDSTTATRVYGQNGVFTTNTANNGTLAANGANCLNQPQGIATDSNGVYIADNGNNRVLFFPNVSTTATRVYGQGGAGNVFTSNTAGNSATALNAPNAVHADTSGVYVGEQANNRVVFFPGPSVTATRFYGQFGSPTCNVANNNGSCVPGTPGPSTLSGPRYVRTLGTHVYINDYTNNRNLYYSGTSTTATAVYGQGGSFSTNGTGLTATSFQQPLGLAIDAAGMYATDWFNSRVLYFSVP